MPLCGFPTSTMSEKSIDLTEIQSLGNKKRKSDNSAFEVTINTLNSYEPLSDMESMDDDEPPPPAGVKPKSSMEKQVKMPPIVVYSYLENHSKALKTLRSACKQDFDVKCRGNRLIFLAKCKEDYNKIIADVTSAKLEYHTYTPADEINRTLVLRNVPPNVTCEEIEDDLKEKHIVPIKITQMTKKEMSGRIIKYPLFLVTFDKSVNVKDVVATNRLCGCIVNWERYKNFSGITQCYKCQAFNHIAKNCYRKPKCLKCAGSHTTDSCTSAPDKSPVCANCGGGHPANHESCLVLQKHKKARQSAANELKSPAKPVFKLNSNEFPSLPKSNIYNAAAPTNSAWRSTANPSTAHPQKASSSAWNCSSSDNSADFSWFNLVHEIKSFLSSFNIGNIFLLLKQCIERLRQAPDALSKISIIADCIFSLI